jgi:hypothetical protein
MPPGQFLRFFLSALVTLWFLVAPAIRAAADSSNPTFVAFSRLALASEDHAVVAATDKGTKTLETRQTVMTLNDKVELVKWESSSGRSGITVEPGRAAVR